MEKLAWCLATKTINNIKIEKETVLEWKRREKKKKTHKKNWKERKEWKEKGHTINAPSYCASVYASLCSLPKDVLPLIIIIIVFRLRHNWGTFECTASGSLDRCMFFFFAFPFLRLFIHSYFFISTATTTTTVLFIYSLRLVLLSF